MSTETLDQQKSKSDSKQEYLETINPATGKKINSYKLMSDSEAKEAVEASHKAFLKWKNVSLEERAKHIKNIGKSFEKNKDKMALLSFEIYDR